MSKADRHADRQKVHKGFLILLLAHTLFTSSCAPEVLLKAGTVEKSWRENKNLPKKVHTFRAIKDKKLQSLKA